jgi:Pyruvate/2-oxoacid:ferredoxin oxidoreductase delta subunit
MREHTPDGQHSGAIEPGAGGTPLGKHEWREVAAAAGAPDVALPWLDRFYEPDDAALVRLAARQPQALSALGRERLDGAVRRAVLDVDEAGAYAPASFHARFVMWAMFEGWKDVPSGVRAQLAEWELDDYTQGIREPLEALRDGRPTGADERLYTYLLLDEAEALIAAQAHVYLWPCDCRAIVGACRKPANVCLRFENDRNVGWEISRERALQVLRQADRAGLMRTAYLGLEPEQAGAICNCCHDCCFPHLATARLGCGDVWPVRRHVARIDAAACEACGRCAARCPFGAIACTKGDGPAVLDAAACRGCGVCASACTRQAIVMQPLA